MGKIESRTAKIMASDEKVFQLFSDLTNFESYIPKDKVNLINTSQESCEFELKGIGKFGLKITEKDPFKLVKISSFGETPLNFLLCINIKHLEENSCFLQLNIETDVNPFLMTMIKSPLQTLVETIIDQMERFSFG
jgi:hypothetical protein